jgi:hypothetical protein
MIVLQWKLRRSTKLTEGRVHPVKPNLLIKPAFSDFFYYSGVQLVLRYLESRCVQGFHSYIQPVFIHKSSTRPASETAG